MALLHVFEKKSFIQLKKDRSTKIIFTDYDHAKGVKIFEVFF